MNRILGWFLWSDAIVGKGHAVLTDTINRALRALMTLCGFDPDQDFTGLAPTFSVHAYGANVGTGSDDTAAFNAAIAAANAAGGGIVRTMHGKTYKVLSVALLSFVTLDITGSTLQKNGGAVGTVAVNMQGALTATSQALTANALSGDTTISVGSSAGFVADDLVLIKDNTFKYTTNGQNQEINRVQSVAAGQVILTKRLLGTYATASTATIVKLSAVDGAKVRGGKIVIPTGTNGGGILADLTNDCTVKSVRVKGPNDMPGVRWDRSRGFKLLYGGIRDGQTPSLQGTSYGWIANESSHNWKVSGVDTENIRENPITNNARFGRVINCTDEGAYDSAFNTHGTGNEHIRFIGCTSLSARQYGFACSFTGNNASDQNISFTSCTVWNSGFNAFVSNGDVGKEPKNISWTDCKADGFGVRVATSAGLLVQNTLGYTISGGDFSAANVAANATQGIYLLSSSDGKVFGATCRDILNGWGIQIQSCTDTLVETCRCKNISSSNIRSVIANTRLTVRNCESDDTAVAKLAGDIFRFNRWGTKFDDDQGSAAAVTDGATIAHNCVSAPSQVWVQGTVASQMVSVTAVAAGTITVAIKTDAGAAGTSQTIHWRVAA